MSDVEISRTLSFIGICKKAGRLISGVPLVCDAMRDGHIFLTVYAGKAGENSVKRICDKAKTYKCPAAELDVTPEELGRAIGKSGAVAAVGIADKGFADAVIKLTGEKTLH